MSPVKTISALSLLTLVTLLPARARASLPPQSVQDVEIGGGPVLKVNTPTLDAFTKLTKATTVKITGSVNFLLAYRVEVAGPKGVFTVPVAARKFSADVPLALNQVNTISFTTISEERTRSAPATAKVTHDALPPVLFIDEPKNQARFTTATVDVMGRVSDALAGLGGLKVTVNPGAVNAIVDPSGTWLAKGVALDTSTPPKPTVIDATAVDSLGNASPKQSVTVHHDKIPPSSPRMVIVSGNGQTGTVGQVLASSAKVKVTHGNGSPFAGKTVQFAVTQSDGKLSATRTGTGSLVLQVVTSSLGEAEAFWRLGSDAGSGNNRLAVTSRDIAGSTPFWASARAGAASRIGASAGDSQKGEVAAPLPAVLDAWVSDGTNGVLGVPVTFTVTQGGGLVNGKSAAMVNTGATGHAVATWTLGQTAGPQLVEASFAGNPGLPVTFSATGLARSAGATSFAGYVFDNANRPLGAATVNLIVNGIPASNSAVLTSDSGFFRFPAIANAGAAVLEVDGATATKLGGKTIPQGSFPKLPFDAVVIQSVENSLQTPVKLPPLDVGNALVFDNTKDVTLTVPGIPGLQLTVKAGSMTIKGTTTKPSPTNPASLILSQVASDQLPVPMANGSFSPLVLSLEAIFQSKSAEAVFDPPIAIEMPNMAGFQPSSTVKFQSFLRDTRTFEFSATARVSKDASTLSSQLGSGLGQTGFHAIAPPGDTITKVQGGGKQPGWVATTSYLNSFQQHLSGNPCKRHLNGTKAGLIKYYDCVKNTAICARQVRVNALKLSSTKNGNLLSKPQTVCMAFVTELLRLIASNNGDSSSGGGNGGDSDAEIRIVGLNDTCTFTRHLSHEAVTEVPARLVDAKVKITMTSPPAGMGVGNAVEFFDMSTQGFRPRTSGYFEITAVDATGKIFDANLEIYEPFVLPIGIATSGGRSAGINSFGGGFTLFNAPAAPNSVLRPQITYIGVDKTLVLAGAFQNTVPNGTTQFAHPPFNVTPVFPISIALTLSKSTLGSIGATSQATVIATTDSGTLDVTSRSKGTIYTSSNTAVATVDQAGLVRAQGRGQAFITALNEGKASVQPILVDLGDPLTTVEGIVQDASQAAVSGATVVVHPSGKTGTTGASGRFSIPGVEARLGNLAVIAEAKVGATFLVGTVLNLVPLPGTTTDAGIITARPAVLWNTDASGFWDVATNWSTSAVPGASDHVIIDRGATANPIVTVRSGTAAVQSLRCEEQIDVTGGVLSIVAPFFAKQSFKLSGGTLRQSHYLPGGAVAAVTASGGTVDQCVFSGALQVPSGATLTALNGLTLAKETGTTNGSLAVAGTLSFSGAQGLFGTGTCVLSGSGALRPSNGLLAIGPGVQVSGNGTVGSTGNSFSNLGTLTVSGTDTMTLTGNWTNEGKIQVTGGAMNLGGVFSLLAGSSFIRSAGTVTLTGTANNTGLVLPLDTAGPWIVQGGTINGGEVKTSATGQLVVKTGTLVKVTHTGGTLSLDAAGTMTTNQGLSNSGRVEIGGGAVWTANGGYVQTGASSRMVLAAGCQIKNSKTSSDLMDFQAGFLEGNGSFNTNVRMNGTVNPGGPTARGAISVVGDYTQTANGVLNIEIEKWDLFFPKLDNLSVIPTPRLGGTLNVTLHSSYVPAAGHSFSPVTSFLPPLAPFATHNLPSLPPPRSWAPPSYGFGGLKLTIN